MTGNAMWRKSSYSGGSGGDCVEVRDDTGRVLVRDTKDRTGPVLPFTPQAWRRFADQVKRSLTGPKARHLRAPSRGCPFGRIDQADAAAVAHDRAGHRHYQWPTSGRHGQGNARGTPIPRTI
jgi:hypothetical protein